MAVSEKNVGDALTYLAQDPHPLAAARFNLTLAENFTRETYAGLFLLAEGTVKERESRADIDATMKDARTKEADCVLEYERHRSRVKAAEMLLEVWRTENANARAAERVR